MNRLVVATRSNHKLREIRQLLGDLPDVRVLDLVEAGVEESDAEDGIEVHDTFSANALAKARYFVPLVRAPVLADDSGLCVDALDGAPGVHSKRFSGREDLQGIDLDRANNDLLLARLRDVPPARRTAAFACAVALATPDGRDAVFLGRSQGRILDAPRGEGGFGYDPLFFSLELGKSFAEADPLEKNRVSHRARAVSAARDLLRTPWIHPAAG
jgi:XTP/dITP diphosphohydrolase